MTKVNLSHLSDEELISSLHACVRRERYASVTTLYHLQEVDLRRLWALRSYSSLFEYAVKELRYGESQAYRILQALRLMNEMPEVPKSLAEGEVSLSTLSKAQSFFKKHAKAENRVISTSEKREIFEKLKNQTEKNAEFILAENSRIEVSVEDKVKILTASQLLLQIVMERDVFEKISILRDLLGNQEISRSNYNDLLNKIFDVAIDKLNPTKERSRKSQASKHRAPSSHSVHKNETSLHAASTKKTEIFPNERVENVAGQSSQNLAQLQTPGCHFGKRHSRRHISIHTKREVWRRDDSKCAFVDPLTKKRCNSAYGVQLDHIHPFALGGSDDLDNLRLHCWSHNYQHAVHTYGHEKMEQYRKRSQQFG